jgi:hypothetical protein
MAAYTTLRSAVGRAPGDVDAEHFVDAWVNLVADAMLGMAGGPTTSAAGQRWLERSEASVGWMPAVSLA